MTDESVEEKKKNSRAALTLWGIVSVTLIAMLLVLIVRTFVVEVYEIKGASMDPTFQSGHRVIVIKLFNTIERRDIVIFTSPDSQRVLVKRVIGMPGDKYELHGQVKTLKLGEYFVMGDNRPDSHDSRFFGPIKADAIIGEVFYRWWPWDKAGGVE